LETSYHPYLFYVISLFKFKNMVHDLVVAGKVVNPGGLYNAQIGIDEGYITALKKQGLQGERQIEVTRGCLIFPGFIDMHAHLREDSSHKWDYKEDFRSGTAAALHGGITTVVDMPNTPLPGVTSERIKAKRELASKGLMDIYFCGGVTESNTNALAAMQDDVVAYKLYLSETTGGLRVHLLSESLKAIEKTAKPVVIHCEDQRIIDRKKAELLRGEDRRSHVELHAELRPEEAELSAVKNVLASVDGEEIKIKLTIAHVSVHDTLRSIRQHSKVHCEVTPHHLFFSKNDVTAKKAFLKTNPPVRTEENRLLLLAAFKKGEIDFLVTDHAPHTMAEKAVDILEAPAGVPNLDTYGNVVAWLIVSCGVNPELIARVCAYNPALFLGLHDRGVIEVGKRANLTVLELQKREKIRSEHLYTKCAWSPFEGVEFPGTVRHTIVNGVVETEYEEVGRHTLPSSQYIYK
jgi:dihydroorotase